jgi:SAM-dependent methyltransferase
VPKIQGNITFSAKFLVPLAPMRGVGLRNATFGRFFPKQGFPKFIMKISLKFHRWCRNQKRRFWDPWTRWPPIGALDFGDLRRLTPISLNFGFDRGNAVDRYYIEKFLQNHSADIQGRVLEIGDDAYTRKYGGQKVTKSDILHVNLQKPGVTIVADLSRADHIPADAFDCFILTQALQLIYDPKAAIKTIYRILKPGGVLLATFPGISQIAYPGIKEQWQDHWRFTLKSAQRMFSEVFPAENLEVQTHGNVLVAAAFLYGLGAEELHHEELDYYDPNYEVLIAVRAVKPG